MRYTLDEDERAGECLMANDTLGYDYYDEEADAPVWVHQADAAVAKGTKPGRLTPHRGVTSWVPDILT